MYTARVAAQKSNAQKARPGGRKSAYTVALGEQICDAHAQGQTITQALTGVGIKFDTHWRWLKSQPGYRQLFDMAHECYWQLQESQLLDIADDGRNDWVEVETARGHSFVKLNDEAVRRSQLRVETRTRLLAVRFPERWAAAKKVDVTSGGKPVAALAQALLDEGREIEAHAETRPH